jgi:hypothetical protein
MKIRHAFFVASLLALSACSTTHPDHSRTAKADPETVLVRYHVKSGKEAGLQATLARAWEIYRRQPLVFAHPHVVVRETEDRGKACFVEVLTWISHSGPEHTPDAVKAVWGQEQALCEDRGGHPGIEIGEVELIVPTAK